MTLVEKYALTPRRDRPREPQTGRSLSARLTIPVPCPALRGLPYRARRGGPGIASAVRFSLEAVEQGVAALRGRAQIITDVRMVEVGISRALLSSLRVTTRCQIDIPRVASRARREGTTRAVAAMRELAPYTDGARGRCGERADSPTGPPGPGQRGEVQARLGHRHAGGFRCLCRIERGAGPERCPLHPGLAAQRRQLRSRRHG